MEFTGGLNMAEIELSHLSRQCLDRRLAHRETLSREAIAWTQRRNEKSQPRDWHSITEDARIRLKRLYPLILN